MPTAEPATTAGTLGKRLLLATGALAAAAGGTALGIIAWRKAHQNEPGILKGSGRGLPENPPSPKAIAEGYETEDMSAAAMGMLTIGLGVAIGISIVLMIVMLNHFQSVRTAQVRLTVEQTTPIPVPLPHLQAVPLAEIANLAATQQHRLDEYAWTGPDHARARIPIAIAIARTVGQSLDAMP